MKSAIFVQCTALVLAAAAILWNLALLQWVFHPGGSGEWIRLAGAFSFFSVPLSLIALITILLVKKGSPSLRRICIVGSVVALALSLFVILVARHG